jgi:hypothetical protein
MSYGNLSSEEARRRIDAPKIGNVEGDSPGRLLGKHASVRRSTYIPYRRLADLRDGYRERENSLAEITSGENKQSCAHLLMTKRANAGKAIASNATVPRSADG